MAKVILTVDDDPVFHAALEAILSTRYEVRRAANGTEALASVAESHPDLILLDVMMDHLSEGFDVARQLKGDEATRHIPIVILSGVDDVYNVRLEIHESWIPYERFLVKPVSPEKLLATVDEVLASAVPKG